MSYFLKWGRGKNGRGPLIETYLQRAQTFAQLLSKLYVHPSLRYDMFSNPLALHAFLSQTRSFTSPTLFDCRGPRGSCGV